MRNLRALAVLLLLLSACTQRVLETTSEVRPSRYAVLEFTQQLPRDSAVAFVQRALVAEGLKQQPGEVKNGVVVAGPVHFKAEGELPELAAAISITTLPDGSATKFRLYASSVIEADQVGGVDARLSALLGRLATRIQALTRGIP